MTLKGPLFPSFRNQAPRPPRRQWLAHSGARARQRNLRRIAEKESQMSNNGQPIPFPTNDIPIVGQAFTVKGGFVTAMLQCGCEAKEPVLLLSNTPGFCAVCRRGYVVMSLAFNGQTGQIQVQIGIAPPQPAPLLAGPA